MNKTRHRLFLIVVIIAAVAGVTILLLDNDYKNREGKLGDLSLEYSSEFVNKAEVYLVVRGLVQNAKLEILDEEEVISIFYELDSPESAVPVTLGDGDRKYQLAARQTISFCTKCASASTPPIYITLDTKPPIVSPIFSQIPTSGNWWEIPVWVKYDNADVATIKAQVSAGDTQLFDVKDGMPIKIAVPEGDVTLEITMLDKANNSSSVLKQYNTFVDRTPPSVNEIIDSDSSIPEGNKRTIESVMLEFGNFTGPLYGYARALVQGYVSGKIKTLTLDGKRISVQPDGTVNTRVRLYVQPGSNTYGVKAVDLFGNEGIGQLSLGWEDRNPPKAPKQSELEERVEELEGRIEELEGELEY